MGGFAAFIWLAFQPPEESADGETSRALEPLRLKAGRSSAWIWTPKFRPTVRCDVMQLDERSQGSFDIVWASPVCTEYLRALSHLAAGDQLVLRTLEIFWGQREPVDGPSQDAGVYAEAALQRRVLLQIWVHALSNHVPQGRPLRGLRGRHPPRNRPAWPPMTAAAIPAPAVQHAQHVLRVLQGTVPQYQLHLEAAKRWRGAATGIFLGPSKSGKTILEQYRTADGSSVFERIFIFSFSVEIDDGWKSVKEFIENEMGVNSEREQVCFDKWDEGALRTIIEQQKKITRTSKQLGLKKLSQVLVVIDDFANQPELHRRTGTAPWTPCSSAAATCRLALGSCRRSCGSSARRSGGGAGQRTAAKEELLELYRFWFICYLKVNMSTSARRSVSWWTATRSRHSPSRR